MLSAKDEAKHSWAEMQSVRADGSGKTRERKKMQEEREVKFR